MSRKGEAEEVEVTRQDQDMINSYGKLNNKLADLKRQRANLEKEKGELKDVEDELMMADEPVLYKIGDSFVSLSKEQAEQRIAGSQKALGDDVARLEGQMQEIQGRMGDLKKVLKGRFGNSINLDPSED